MRTLLLALCLTTFGLNAFAETTTNLDPKTLRTWCYAKGRFERPKLVVAEGEPIIYRTSTYGWSWETAWGNCDNDVRIMRAKINAAALAGSLVNINNGDSPSTDITFSKELAVSPENLIAICSFERTWGDPDAPVLQIEVEGKRRNEKVVYETSPYAEGDKFGKCLDDRKALEDKIETAKSAGKSIVINFGGTPESDIQVQ